MNEVHKKESLTSPSFSLANKVLRVLWICVYVILFRYSPIFAFGWRRGILRLFGARLHRSVRVYPSCNIWAPWNLTVSENSTIGPKVKLYNQAKVVIGARVIVSQYAYICASSHNYNDPLHPLTLHPIRIGESSWICADAFIGPGADIGAGSVIGARAVVFKPTEPWGVYVGNPATRVKGRSKEGFLEES